VDLALRFNPSIQQARQELQASYGVSMQILSAIVPKLKVDGGYVAYDARNANTVGAPENTHRWTADIRLVQSIYEGGRLLSATKTARLTRQRAELDFQSLLASKIMEIRDVYYDTLLAMEQAKLSQATMDLLEKQSEEVSHQQGVGLAQRYDALKAESALANARTTLIRANNSLRIAKLRFVKLLGLNLAENVRDEVPLILGDSLEPQLREVDLNYALIQAMGSRAEIKAQEKTVALMRERVTHAKSGYKPSVQVLGGYGGLADDLNRDIYGFFGGAQLSWNIFDGLETRGKIHEAAARLDQAESSQSEMNRTVDLEVREAHAHYRESQELLESQKKAQQLAEEGLRLATSRRQAGELMDVDVLAAQVALQDARFATAQVFHDYDTALTALDRATGVLLQVK